MTGAQLRRIRRAGDLSQSDAARVVRVDKNTIARYERGELSISEPMSLLFVLALGGFHKHDFVAVKRRRGPHIVRCRLCGLYLGRAGKE